MSHAEELLNSLSEEEVSVYITNTDVEPHIIIGDDRVITVPDELKRIAVQYDHNIETVTFDCPRYWDEHDMSKMRIYINYMRADGETGSYLVTRLSTGDVGENLMEFDWTISRNVTEVKGTIAFLVCVKNVDEAGNETNHWNSELNKDMYVSEGLECSETIAEAYPDIITQLLNLQTTQSDYMQNSPAAPDHIKNRTHWASEGDVVLPYTEIALSTAGKHVLQGTLPIVEGNKYVVTWDDTKYLCEAVNHFSTMYLGNCASIGLADTGEPFMIDTSNDYIRFTCESAPLTTLSVRITSVDKIHKLSKHYLPDDIGGKSDLAVNDPEASGYVANRTHWKEPKKVNTLTWDGSTEGREVNSNNDNSMLVKISDEVISFSDLIGATLTWSTGNTETLTESDLFGENQPVFGTGAMGVSVYTVDGKIMNGVPMSKGIWFFAYENGRHVTSLTCLTDCFTTGEEIYHKLDRNYLPDDIGSTPDLAQNDPTAKDYVKNRTHRKYISEVDIVPEMSVDLKNNVDTFYVGDAGYIALELGKTYNAYLDGVKYENLAVKNLTLGDVVIYYIGNDPTDNSFSELPFSYTYRADIGASTLAYNIGTTTVTFRLTEIVEAYEPFDGRYLPKGLGYIIKEGEQIATNTLEWDGDMSGKEAIDISDDGSIYLVKVSDAVADMADIIGATIIAKTVDGDLNPVEQSLTVAGENITDMSPMGAPAYLVFEGLIYVVLDDFSEGGKTFTRGIWLMRNSYGDFGNGEILVHIKSITALTDCFVTGTSTEVKKIDNRLLDLEWIPTKTVKEIPIWDNVSLELSGNFTDGATAMLYSSNDKYFELVSGKKYNVTWNGNAYKNLEALEFEGGAVVVIGNLSSEGGSGAGIPFFIAHQIDSALTLIRAVEIFEDATVTVSVAEVEYEYNKLAKEYLDLSEIQQPEVVTVSNFPELVTYTPYNAAMKALKKGLSVETEDGGRVLWAFTNNDAFASCAAVWVTRNTLNFYHAVDNKHYKALLLPTDAESGKLLRTTDGGYELVDPSDISSSGSDGVTMDEVNTAIESAISGAIAASY